MQKDPTWMEVGEGVGVAHEGTLGFLSLFIPPLPVNTSVFFSLPHTFSASFAHLLTPVELTFCSEQLEMSSHIIVPPAIFCSTFEASSALATKPVFLAMLFSLRM